MSRFYRGAVGAGRIGGGGNEVCSLLLPHERVPFIVTMNRVEEVRRRIVRGDASDVEDGEQIGEKKGKQDEEAWRGEDGPRHGEKWSGSREVEQWLHDLVLLAMIWWYPRCRCLWLFPFVQGAGAADARLLSCQPMEVS